MKKAKLFFYIIIVVMLSFFIGDLTKGFNTVRAMENFNSYSNEDEYLGLIFNYRFEDMLKKQLDQEGLILLDVKENRKPTILSSKNYSQSSLNDYYNKYYLPNNVKKINGTCGIVSTLTALEFYSRKHPGIFSINNPYYSFVRIFNRTKEDGYIDSTSGVSASKMGWIIYNAFDEIIGNTNEFTTSNNGYNILAKIRNEINSGRVMPFTIPGHSMVARGLAYFDIKYSFKWSPSTVVTQTVEFIIVNEGWYSGNHLSYYPAHKISNWFNGNYSTHIIKK